MVSVPVILPTDPRALRDVAVAVAQAAAEHVRIRRPEVFGAASPARVRTKSSPTDPVTVVDTETELLVRELLDRHRPGERLLGEEESGDPAAVSGLRWVVDPIDGTVNFLYGIPSYAVSLAVQIDGRSVAGAVVDVARATTYAAALGDGAFRTGPGGRRRLRCSTPESLSTSLVAVGFGYAAERRATQARLVGALLPQVRDIRRFGSASLDLCMVAAGELDGYLEHGLGPWDWAAGALIANEAGARVRLPGPAALSADGEITVAAAATIAEDLDAALAAIGGLDPIR